MARKSKKHSKLLKNRRLVLSVCVVLLVLVGAYWLFWIRNTTNLSIPNPTASTTKTGKTASGGYVNLSPPTADDKQAANDIKNQATQTTTPPTTSDGRTQVTVNLSPTGSSNVIKFYVTGVAENGGTCTATATSSSAATQSQTSQGFINAGYTQCYPITLSLSPGTWSVSASYSSAGYSGISAQPQTVTISSQ